MRPGLQSTLAIADDNGIVVCGCDVPLGRMFSARRIETASRPVMLVATVKSNGGAACWRSSPPTLQPPSSARHVPARPEPAGHGEFRPAVSTPAALTATSATTGSRRVSRDDQHRAGDLARHSPRSRPPPTWPLAWWPRAAACRRARSRLRKIELAERHVESTRKNGTQRRRQNEAQHTGHAYEQRVAGHRACEPESGQESSGRGWPVAGMRARPVAA